MEERLKTTLVQAISEFNSKRAEILQLAFDQGGRPAVTKLEQEYDALRDAYFEICKQQLDKNNHLYVQLINTATDETDKLRNTIQSLTNINDITNSLTIVVNIIGRLIIVLG